MPSVAGVPSVGGERNCHTHRARTRTHTHAYTHMHVHAQTHVYMYTCMHTHAHIPTHIYTDIHKMQFSLLTPYIQRDLSLLLACYNITIFSVPDIQQNNYTEGG